MSPWHARLLLAQWRMVIICMNVPAWMNCSSSVPVAGYHTVRLLTGSLLCHCRVEYIHCSASCYFKSCKTRAVTCLCEQDFSDVLFSPVLHRCVQWSVQNLTLHPQCYVEEEMLTTRVRKLKIPCTCGFVCLLFLLFF